MKRSRTSEPDEWGTPTRRHAELISIANSIKSRTAQLLEVRLLLRNSLRTAKGPGVRLGEVDSGLSMSNGAVLINPFNWDSDRAPGLSSADAGTRAAPLPPLPFPRLRRCSFAGIRIGFSDEAEQFLHHRGASVATLRRCSGPSRIRRSASLESPTTPIQAATPK
jgi:hypothetical protein